MSKYPFFAKKGRPSSAEREVCTKINKLINSGAISENEINEFISTSGTPETQEELETLYALLTGEEAIPVQQNQNNQQYQDDLEEDVDDSFSEPIEKNTMSQEKIENPIDFTPFDEPVIEREYTKGFVVEEEDVPSDFQQFDDNGNAVDFTDEELQRPPVEQEIPEPDWASGMGGGGGISDAEYSEETQDGEEPLDEDGGKLGGDNLQDLSPQQKRKSAEKTADAILSMYCNFAPLPFKKWASFNDTKIQKMVFEDKLDMNMQLENNVTVRDYIKSTNEQVDEIFEVSDETREEIKDPLVDVLLEQDLALTPTQRLLFAVGGHVLQMGFSAYQLAQNNKISLEAFEKYHKEFRAQNGGGNKRRPSNAPPQSTQNDFNQHEKEEIEKIMREMETDNDGVIDADSDPSIEVTESYD